VHDPHTRPVLRRRLRVGLAAGISMMLLTSALAGRPAAAPTPPVAPVQALSRVGDDFTLFQSVCRIDSALTMVLEPAMSGELLAIVMDGDPAPIVDLALAMGNHFGVDVQKLQDLVMAQDFDGVVAYLVELGTELLGEVDVQTLVDLVLAQDVAGVVTYLSGLGTGLVEDARTCLLTLFYDRKAEAREAVCEAITPPHPPRSAKDIVHVANICLGVGTDIEFQSRTLADGTIRDYAILGTIGDGTHIIDITDPALPHVAATYSASGRHNDVALYRDASHDLLFVAFDADGANTSECLRGHGGVDIVEMNFNPATGDFRPVLLDCYVTADGTGAHTITMHPSGKWLSINTAEQGVEILLLGTIPASSPGEFMRLSGGPKIDSRFVDLAHDVSFSQAGSLLVSAGVDSARVVELAGSTLTQPTLSRTIDDPEITVFHQADLTATGDVLVVSDERVTARVQGLGGDGDNEVRCHADGSQDNIGSLYFFSPATGVRLGSWTYPALAITEPLDTELRLERGCTVHVFRIGGNGPSGPGGPGASTLPATQLVVGHHGAGVWWVDFTDPKAPTSRGWNIMPGTEAWSAKEFKGLIYSGDMLRGFDVYKPLTNGCHCEGIECIYHSGRGRASGGGKVKRQSSNGTEPQTGGSGNTAEFTFGFGVSHLTGCPAPEGSFELQDRIHDRNVHATSWNHFTVSTLSDGVRADFAGTATVTSGDGTRSAEAISVQVVDRREPGTTDSIKIQYGDTTLEGALTGGNIQVEREKL
jgi:hypothetical protein